MKILVTGSAGQIGSALTLVLREKIGVDNVIAAWRNSRPPQSITKEGENVSFDCCDRSELDRIVVEHDIKKIYHLAAILSGRGEEIPLQCFHANTNGLLNILECARERDIQVFFASSIAVFGPSAEKIDAPQDSVLQPSSMYGVSKVTGELLASYYHSRYKVDVRGLRYVGVLTADSRPSRGGTTDFALEMLFQCHDKKYDETYQCPLRLDTRLPWMSMNAATRAAIELMEAPSDQIKVRTAYNITGVSFSIEEWAKALGNVCGHEFKIEHVPVEGDRRQLIADSVPQSLNCSDAACDWKWEANETATSLARTLLESVKND